MKTLFFSIFIAATCCSCTTVVKAVYGIKQPKVENRTSLNTYLVSIGSDTTNNLVVKPEYYGNVYNAINRHFPEALVYDKNGYLVTYRPKNTTCIGFIEPFLDSLNDRRIYPVDSSKVLGDMVSKITNTEFDLKEKNYTMLIFWFKPLGKLNKTYVNKWEMEARKSGQINVFKVNMDMQENWTDEQYKILAEGMKADKQ